MISYDLVDIQLKNYYIIVYRNIFIIGLFLITILSILSMFYKVMIIFLVMVSFIDLIFLITWNINKKKYGNKFSFSDGKITVYNYKNSKIKELTLDKIKYCYLNISFDEYPRYKYKTCLILYKDIEIYEKMEYSSWWSNPKLVIIQNKQLIEILEKNIINHIATD